MGSFLVRRLVQAVAIVFFAATATFFLFHIAPGDPVSAQFGERLVSPQVVAQYRTAWGLDQPLRVQYTRYLAHLARGDLGRSFSLQRPVAEIIRDRLPNTMLLAVAALAISFVVGMTLGTIQGARTDSGLDHALTVVTLALFSTPVFWLGLVLLLVFGQALGWFPIGAAVSPVYSALPWFGKLVDRLHHLVLPALTLGLGGAAVVARFHRAEVAEAIAEAFVRTARANGISERTVLFRHALRNALLPAITLFGLSLPIVFSGAVLVEQVFGWPGMGLAAFEAVGRRDYNVVTGIALLGSVFVVAGNLLSDVLYRMADPRSART